jgi:prepilin-type N-terminal cleavage/methylation domain-containing protein
MTARLRQRAGFTLLELLLALTVGLVVLTAATKLAAMTWVGVRGLSIRDDITRNARYIGLSLQRDVQETGVDLTSSVDFGTLASFSDTVTFLRVPYAPNASNQYPLSTSNFATGVCGATCVEIRTGGPVPDIAVGDLARVQASNTRRLIYVTDVAAVNGGYRIQFTNNANLLHHTAGIGGLAINPATTFVQKLGLVAYWRENGQLMRAQGLNANLSLAGESIATGVQALTTTLIFINGAEAAQADNGTDGDSNNDYDDIAALRIRATVQGDRTDPHVNGGLPVQRQLQWWFAPRNLIYERNRI